MVKIPYIKIPGVRVGSIGPASNIGTGGATPAPPTPITYLTQWQIVGNSEVHTLPYPDGVVLPNGYKRCKYLEFHGAEYLNTGIKTNDGIGMSLTFSTTTESKTIIGARMSASSNVFVLGLFTSSRFITGYGSYAQEFNAPVRTLDGQRHTFTLSNTQCTLDNINVSVNFGTFNTPNANDIYIGTWNINGTPDDRYYEGKIYSIRLYDSNGSLFNGIPCLDDNNVPCLYDTVSGTSFYNNGTGTFGYEIEPQPTEIWSCGEYNPIDGKWHILVQPQGGSIADIALDEPLRKVNNVADTIEFPSETEGKALVTRHFNQVNAIGLTWTYSAYSESYLNFNNKILGVTDILYVPNLIVTGFDTVGYNDIKASDFHATTRTSNNETYIFLHSNTFTNKTEFENYIQDKIIIYELATPTTELVDAPQIQEADSYSCVISQGGKAVEWSSFITNSE